MTGVGERGRTRRCEIASWTPSYSTTMSSESTVWSAKLPLVSRLPASLICTHAHVSAGCRHQRLVQTPAPGAQVGARVNGQRRRSRSLQHGCALAAVEAAANKRPVGFSCGSRPVGPCGWCVGNVNRAALDGRWALRWPACASTHAARREINTSAEIGLERAQVRPG